MAVNNVQIVIDNGGVETIVTNPVPSVVIQSGMAGGGSTTFLGLLDAPHSYAGQALQLVRVNAGETGLEFVPVAGSNPFADNTALVKNNADNTKLLILSAAAITTGTTRTWTFPDVNGTVARNDAAQTFTGKQTFSPVAGGSGLNVGSIAGNPGVVTNGDIWYNTSGNALNARINGVTVSLGAGGGITNSAANNEIMKSNGTNAVPSGTFSTAAGDLTFGTALAGSARNLTADGSATDVTLNLIAKGNGGVSAYAPFGVVTSSASVLFVLFSGGNTEVRAPIFDANTISYTTSSAGGAPSSSSSMIFKTGNAGTSGNRNSGNIFIDMGTKNGTGTVGSLGLFTTSAGFGSGEKVIFIGDATTNPTTNPTSGFILYSDSANSSHPTVRLPSGTVVDLVAGGGGGLTYPQVMSIAFGGC